MADSKEKEMKPIQSWKILPSEPFNTRIWQEIASQLIYQQLSTSAASLKFDGVDHVTLFAGNRPNTKVS